VSEKKRLGRPPKFAPDELRARLVGAGVEALVDNGVSHGLDAVRLDQAIQQADVPRGSAYRMWENESGTPPQEAFRRAVLIDLLRTTPTSRGLDATWNVALKELENVQPLLDSGDPDDYKTALRRMIRTASEVNFSVLDNSKGWNVYAAAASAAVTQPSSDPEIVEAIQFGEEQLIARYTDFFAHFASIFGMRIRDGLNIEDFAVAVYALNHGLSTQISDKRRVVDISVEGESEPWTLLAIAFEALVDRFFERVEAN